MTSNTSTYDPAPTPEKPQAVPGGLTSEAPSPAALSALQADLAAGRITLSDFLTRLAEMQAAFIGG